MPRNQRKKAVRKSEIAEGLQHLMNNSPVKPFTQQGGAAFKQMMAASGMPVSQMLKYVGQKGRSAAKEEQARIEGRLDKLEGEQK